MKYLLIGLIIILAIFFSLPNFVGAEEKKTEKGIFTVDVSVEKSDLKVGENRPIKLILRDSSGNPVEGANIEATPWMTEHGHGSTKKTHVREEGKGLYIVENVYLTMKGKWDLIIEIKYSGKEDSTVIPLPKVK